MKRFMCLLAMLVLTGPGPAFADKGDNKTGNNKPFKEVKARQFDPQKTSLVQGEWLSGIGCPTEAKTAMCDPNDPNCNKTVPGPTYTDPACPTGDPKDRRNQGLLLAKTGPTPNVAAAFAELKHVRGIVLTELGYDIRKPGPDVADARGSHCGAGAPRFNVETTTGFFFVGCNSPAPDTQTVGDGFIRLRWGPALPVQGFNAATGVLEPITGTVRSISIVFDEGTDTGPDNFGLAVLDNIDVNGTLVGRHDDGED
jgi:hypothetical protein